MKTLTVFIIVMQIEFYFVYLCKYVYSYVYFVEEDVNQI